MEPSADSFVGGDWKLHLASEMGFFLYKAALVAAMAACLSIKLGAVLWRVAAEGIATGFLSCFQDAVQDDRIYGPTYYDKLAYCSCGHGCIVEAEHVAGALQQCTARAGAEGCRGTELWRCAICLSTDRDQEPVARLQHCSHVFHRACLAAFLICCRHHCRAGCPICRRPLFYTSTGLSSAIATAADCSISPTVCAKHGKSMIQG